MSDELTFQPQVVQPKKDNSALYGGIGAVGGAAAGYGINRWVQKPMSHDDIIKDANANDRAEFSKKYDTPIVIASPKSCIESVRIDILFVRKPPNSSNIENNKFNKNASLMFCLALCLCSCVCSIFLPPFSLYNNIIY